jgi:hypothetical protein
LPLDITKQFLKLTSKSVTGNQRLIGKFQNGLLPKPAKRKPRFPYVQRFTKKDKLYLRFRRKGHKGVALPGPLGSPQFIKAYAAALTQPTAQPAFKSVPVQKENVSGQWMYIIAYGKRDLVKIGTTTTRLRKRLAALQATSAEPLRVLATFPGGHKVERQLHELFAKQRVWNEFFRRDELIDLFLTDIEFKSLPDVIAHIEVQKAWLQRPERERRAIERKRAAIERKRGLVPIYPYEWNEARLEAGRKKRHPDRGIGGGVITGPPCSLLPSPSK